MWHRLLCFLRIRDEFDYVPPFAPEVKHPFEKDERLNCCTHCGGGRLHEIHEPPFDPRRLAEILGNPPFPMRRYEGPVTPIGKQGE